MHFSMVRIKEQQRSDRECVEDPLWMSLRTGIQHRVRIQQFRTASAWHLRRSGDSCMEETIRNMQEFLKCREALAVSISA